MLVSGVWNSFIKLGMPVLALALVALQGGATARRVLAAVLGIGGLVAAIVVFALLLRSAEQARRFGLLAGRAASRVLGLVGRRPVAGWELATVTFRARTIELVEHRWRSITVWSLVSHLSLYLVLLITLGDVGVSDAEVSWAEVLAVFAFARLATAIPLTPGGLGLVEGVLFTGLVGAGGDPDQVAAAVLVYRALTWALPILVGVGCHVWWRRRTWTATQDPQRGQARRPSLPAPTPRPKADPWTLPSDRSCPRWLARRVLAPTGPGRRDAVDDPPARHRRCLITCRPAASAGWSP